MRTFVPGTMSPEYIDELRKLQTAFLDGITEDPAETAKRDEAYRKWVESTHKRESHGISQKV
jgi:hypothetical protein